MFPSVQVEVSIPSIRLCAQQVLNKNVEDIMEAIQDKVSEMKAGGQLDALVADEAKRALEEVLKEEVRNYFRFGNGRMSVRNAAWAALDEMFSDVKDKSNAG